MPRGEDPDFQAPQFSVVVIYPGNQSKRYGTTGGGPDRKKLNELDDIKRIISQMDDGLA